MNNKKILIFLTAYMEPELQNTVKSFYNNAEYKDRLLFSIVCQDFEYPDLSFIPEKQLRYLKINAKETYGYSWAKKIASIQFADFDYFFSIDGHMIPEEKWDTRIIKFYEKEKNNKGKIILNAKPIGYKFLNGERTTSDNKLIADDKIHFNAAADIKTLSNSASMGEQGWWPENTRTKDEIEEIYYIWASCIFGEKEFLDEVPIDPEISFYHEERSLTIRSFSKHYKIIYFKEPKIYHMYFKERDEYKKILRSAQIITDKPDIELEKASRYDDFLNLNVNKQYAPTKSGVEYFIKKIKE